MKVSSIHVQSIGCRLNQCEADDLRRELELRGYRSSAQDSDLCVLNTCTVTGRADRKSRKLISRMKNLHPRAKIIVTGCYATTNEAEIREEFGDSLILNNQSKDDLADRISSLFPCSAQKRPGPEPAQGRSRVYLKIQDGCNERCTYCKVWQARGGSRSVPLDRVVQQAEQIFARGFEEIVLTGVNITHYYHQKNRLEDLLKSLLALDLPVRYRLSSLKPDQCTPDLLDLIRDRRICDYFHLSLQSAHPRILQLMGRNYTPNQVEEIIARIRELRPDAGIGADIIAGFPSESTQEFQETRNRLEEWDIPFLHVFPYSDRENTPASSFPGRIPFKVRESRADELKKLRSKMKSSFQKRFIGRTVEVITQEGKGVSSNYLDVRFPSGSSVPYGIRKTVRILGLDGQALSGELL